MHGQHIYREFTYLVDVQHCGCYQKCCKLCTLVLIQIYSVLGNFIIYILWSNSTANLNVKIRTAVLLQFFEVEEIYLWLDIKHIKHHENQMNCHYVYLNLSFNTFVVKRKTSRKKFFERQNTHAFHIRNNSILSQK